jgi:hypothetical protein
MGFFRQFWNEVSYSRWDESEIELNLSERRRYARKMFSGLSIEHATVD